MPTTCQSCGMPLSKKENFALGDESSQFCAFCTNPDGSVKPCQEIFKGGVEYFMGAIKADKAMAERVTRKNMLKQPYWQGKDIEVLKGDVASDEEFSQVLKQI